MSIYDEMAADAAGIFSEFGKEVGIAGRTLPALISEPQETLELGAGGFTASGNFTVKLLRNNDNVEGVFFHRKTTNTIEAAWIKALLTIWPEIRSCIQGQIPAIKS